MTGLMRSISLFAIISSVSSTTVAQQSSPVPNLTQAGQQNEPVNKTEDDQNKSDQKQINGTSTDRLFFVLPNFLTLETAQSSPLSLHEKFKVVFQSSFDYVQYPWYSLLAGISQTENSEPATGRDPQGTASATERHLLMARSRVS